MMKLSLIITASLAISSFGLQAATVLYDFNANGNGASDDVAITGAAVGFTEGTVPAASTAKNGERSHSSIAADGENEFFVSSRSFGNHAPSGGVPSPGDETYLTFTLNSTAPDLLDFSSASFSFDATTYNDTSNTSFRMDYQLYADTGDGSGFVAIGGLQSLEGNTAASPAPQSLTTAADESLTGWNLDTNLVRTNSASFTDIDLSSLGAISGDEIIFAIALVGTRNNNINFATTLDNVEISGISVIPEPASSALLGLAGLAFLCRKRR
ncbi:PEP-CTERM sorting domain-containing protein [Persicirhabdus sediminis]|uniref:PEP-CTERM sorting domain-containing protein n=1 Tax=Persicirhabdus sediminis TaxID=454144 RepID=A0A8J7SIG9_9BACT|nr:PEP-CTERM sorting domain-containing protein [Persicirhabdus sediminis]MBK1790436.1 PEP-CTERM sorting domain-containing protein [Persicirhabdus sediminis]